jgi:hypothetical protein
MFKRVIHQTVERYCLLIFAFESDGPIHVMWTLQHKSLAPAGASCLLYESLVATKKIGVALPFASLRCKRRMSLFGCARRNCARHVVLREEAQKPLGILSLLSQTSQPLSDGIHPVHRHQGAKTLLYVWVSYVGGAKPTVCATIFAGAWCHCKFSI